MMQEAAEGVRREVGNLEDALARDREQRRNDAEIALAQFAALVARLEKCLGDAMKFLQGEDDGEDLTT